MSLILEGGIMSKDEYRRIIENMHEGVYYVDKNRKITCWNHGAERITGFSASEVINSHCYNNILNHQDSLGNKLCFGGCPLQKSLEDFEVRDALVYLHHKEGHRVPVKVKTFPIFEDGELIGAAEVFTDETENINMFHDMEQLKKLAMYDQLTELPNRRYLDSYLNSKMTEFITVGIPFGIVFMDIDHFKNFNDAYGHDVGDEVLIMVSKSLKSAIRTSDIVGRWGGEEFIAIFTGIGLEEIETISENMRKFVEMSSLREEHDTLGVTISLGGTVVRALDTVESIVKRADQLMYKSKNAGRNKSTIL